jgi:hypothetical protein
MPVKKPWLAVVGKKPVFGWRAGQKADKTIATRISKEFHEN